MFASCSHLPMVATWASDQGEEYLDEKSFKRGASVGGAMLTIGLHSRSNPLLETELDGFEGKWD